MGEVLTCSGNFVHGACLLLVLCCFELLSRLRWEVLYINSLFGLIASCNGRRLHGFRPIHFATRSRLIYNLKKALSCVAFQSETFCDLFELFSLVFLSSVGSSSH